jgi:hypothetical protein
MARKSRILIFKNEPPNLEAFLSDHGFVANRGKRQPVALQDLPSKHKKYKHRHYHGGYVYLERVFPLDASASLLEQYPNILEQHIGALDVYVHDLGALRLHPDLLDKRDELVAALKQHYSCLIEYKPEPVAKDIDRKQSRKEIA